MPRVSVILPNYNHARFLRQRWESICAQTFTDWEAILLDDASTDDSRSLLDEFRTHSQVRHVIYNPVNSGSAFRQWNRGFALATGDFVWIAESDDFAAPDFLERLLLQVDTQPNIGIAYSQSYRVSADGTIEGTNREYTDFLDRERWQQNFVASGREECATTLFQMNIIPNASATLLRRRLVEEVGGADAAMRLCGDHLLYTEMLLRSDLAYVAEPLNAYRFHGASVRSRTYYDGTFVREMYRIQKRILDTVPVQESLQQRVFTEQLRHWAQSVYAGAPWHTQWAIYQAARATDRHLHRRLLWFFLQATVNRLGLRRRNP
jgi:glycosyltransferase involved in cell wall biosynthesis